ncbi:hydrogenase expression/formation protein HypE [Niallia oryzisoli]|uniref:hydrogenase expression/formation protein HypE n=1 Tax=Niallia oryzisoli TaxID=1737571 RepID=UPI003734F844
MNKVISLAHGDGGELSHRLIRDLFVKNFGHYKEAMFDASYIQLPANNIAVTTDSFVVKPLFFPDCSIGKLAVAGTVNDLAVSGAKPLYLTCGFVIEEGFSVNDLEKIVSDMANEAKAAGISIIAGDTKVVEKGSCDGVYINTTGIGIIQRQNVIPNFKSGDAIILSGTLGDHGIAILTARGELGIHVPVASDCSSLNSMLEDAVQAAGDVRIMRDPTRGGLATTLVEIAEDFSLSLVICEKDIPVKEQVQGACDLLGFDPLYLANEGKAIIIVESEKKDAVLHALHMYPEGKDAVCIGKVVKTEQPSGQLYLETLLGTKRRINRLAGVMLPRIC